MENWRVIPSTGGLIRRLALGYIRQNLDTFNLTYRSIDRINKVHPEKLILSEVLLNTMLKEILLLILILLLTN